MRANCVCPAFATLYAAAPLPGAGKFLDATITMDGSMPSFKNGAVYLISFW